MSSGAVSSTPMALRGAQWSLDGCLMEAEPVPLFDTSSLTRTSSGTQSNAT